MLRSSTTKVSVQLGCSYYTTNPIKLFHITNSSRNPDERSHKARVLKPAEIKKLSNNTQGCAKQIQDIYSREEPLPCFIQPLRNGLDKYDRRYLSIKGVFNLPDAHLQNVLLRAYIENIHPLLPVLELDSFIEAIFTLHDQTTSKPQSWVSLLLYWAVMYSAISTVTPETIQKAGFHSRHDAQCSFFGRIKVRIFIFCINLDESSSLMLFSGALRYGG